MPIQSIPPAHNVNSSAVNGFSVTPHDSTNFAIWTDSGLTSRALWIGVTGDVAVVFANDAAVTFKNVPVGFLDVMAKRVNSTGTTASQIVAVY